MKFERAAFKLTKEMLKIMEGTESSTLQQAIGHFESTSLF